MLIALGLTVVLLSVFGGFVLSGGSLGPLYQPTELLMIGGAGIGAFIAANNGKAIKATLKAISRFKRSTKYDKALYMALMTMMYNLLSKARREGMMALERDVDDPQQSPDFNQFPQLSNDPLIINFITDYLRLLISSSMQPHELDELMMHEIEEFEHEAALPSDALYKVSDGLPAFGIVAAVMGVVKALSAAGVGPEEMGQMIAHALVGTFLGIYLAYGVVAPLACRIERQAAECTKMLHCIRVTLVANLQGMPPQLAVEFGRKALHVGERPSALELENHVRSGGSSASTNKSAQTGA
ncbi:flagellar motor stator protein MotA [Pseudomonas lijiangensis]|uniref:Flagellar motor stator protein MotA n=1 Tax=Pseudomonas lijiangensis TaxID=2995658 RepID=A0ABX8HUJ5_9PSED|nr:MULTISPECIES: flagellar motor stator protein MotA [Pseudomonas syringae group]MBX8501109.1 flagellar motor stator protein MotA [Pseudomonas lijiangensis]MBX8505943.1 flagellar motor stator protein MotA [Pseudomonas lijiangensis]MBX8520669.1 flagellar motor stator protein MotA [Pseudomonas cichorii]MBX8554076.1 flagellar motor stator protein MotA [Pseudomonas cichorii]QWU83188.1 flagellar motor stator protein MotA [Pseudomonas lijiangensis]